MRISQKLIITGLLLILVALLIPGSVAKADEIVAFADLSIETAVRREI